MKNLLEKNLKKLTNTRYEFRRILRAGADTQASTGTDPTNTTITVLTTVSNPFKDHLRKNLN